MHFDNAYGAYSDFGNHTEEVYCVSFFALSPYINTISTLIEN